MAKLAVFNSVSTDGYFTGPNDDISWTKEGADDPEWGEWVSGNAGSGGVLVFGRKTYDMMKSFWPTPQAMQMMPEVAKGMNDATKIVFSRTLDRADWSNTKLVKGDLVEEIKRLKKEPGADMVILGSGSIVSQAAQNGLVDQYTMVVVPVVLGRGRTMFEGMRDKLALKLKESRAFRNGRTVQIYTPAR